MDHCVFPGIQPRAPGLVWERAICRRSLSEHCTGCSRSLWTSIFDLQHMSKKKLEKSMVVVYWQFTC
ncbi:hypothetical protein Y032_0299g1788 [Ancylostoma ceylanicum]|uniref:Uncharacterized protein n=1 Tax=Ancylostoma ceylanicum TaxID=53326 RepID=A0A016S581_9BILA|nr:hypothetical protein Y032_0299g1788 [Ancylostoma ceylanicum]